MFRYTGPGFTKYFLAYFNFRDTGKLKSNISEGFTIQGGKGGSSFFVENDEIRSLSFT